MASSRRTWEKRTGIVDGVEQKYPRMLTGHAGSDSVWITLSGTSSAGGALRDQRDMLHNF